MVLLQTVGRTFLNFLAAAGRLAIFTTVAVSHCFRPPFYPRLLVRQMIEIGYYSLPVVGLTAIFTGMVLAGLAFCLAGGCPGRQLFLAGEGDGDAAVFVLGMIVGAAFAHNFGLASSPKGVGPHGIAAVIIGLLVCSFIGLTMRQKA